MLLVMVGSFAVDVMGKDGTTVAGRQRGWHGVEGWRIYLLICDYFEA
jgi:hypothetical protein